MDTFARATGFAAAWVVFSAALTVASRSIRLGPGFSNPAPYAAAAILLYACGRLIRFWLHEREPAPQPIAYAGLRRLGRSALDGLRAFFRGPAACNNFLFLSVAYFIGIGVSSLFIREKSEPSAGPQGKGLQGGTSDAKTLDTSGTKALDTYWQDLNLGNREADAYYRPF